MNTNSKNLNSCYYCNFCYYCYFCNTCNYLNSCNSCYYCYYCNYCSSCSSCNFCSSCDYCKNLKMTEYNTFCYSSRKYNDETSFQQGRYRIFNREVGNKRYFKLKAKVKEILSGIELELNKNSWEKEWEKVTPAQWRELMDLAYEVRGDNFKEGFEFISSAKIEEEPMITLPDGRKFSASTIQEALKKYVDE